MDYINNHGFNSNILKILFVHFVVFEIGNEN